MRGPIGPHLSFYNLRHTYASHLVMRGVHIRASHELVGHKTLAMTQRYSHLAPEQLQNAVKLLNGVNGEREYGSGALYESNTGQLSVSSTIK